MTPTNYIGLYNHIRIKKITQTRLISHLHLTYILFNIYSYIKCGTLIHTWHINISPFQTFYARDRPPRTIPFSQNVEPRYHAYVELYEGANTGVVLHVLKRVTI